MSLSSSPKSGLKIAAFSDGSPMLMKRTIVYCSIIIWTLVLIASCGRHRQVVHGFVDAPQDSILFDLKDYVLPASEVDLWNVVKCGGYYYFTFHEQRRGKWVGSHFFLMGASEDKLQARYIPLPDNVKSISSTFVRNDSLIMESDDDQLFLFDSKKWSWSPLAPEIDEEGTLYEDDDWMVKLVSHGEFGKVSWFIDKHSQEEYAFVELNGGFRRIGNTFYVVTLSRIYEIPDPTIGFHCDSSTRYENAKDARLLAHHFFDAGYEPMRHFVNPVVRFDDFDLLGEFILPDGSRVYHNPYEVFNDYLKADTTFVASFCASDTLFCALNTLSGLELAKLEDTKLVPVHHFNKSIGSNYPYHYFNDYPSISAQYKYRDESNPTDYRLLLVINTEAGSSELIDIAHNGNILLKLCYDTCGLDPVEQDGFGELLVFYLKNWDQLTWDKVIQEEKYIGGEISYLNLETNRNSFPPRDVFREDEQYHIDIVSKQISDSYEVESSYWVQESNNSVPAVYLEWSSLRYNSGFDPKAKYEEIVGIITDSVGPGTLFPQTSSKMMYSEWQTGQRIIRLYGNAYDVRFLMF